MLKRTCHLLFKHTQSCFKVQTSLFVSFSVRKRVPLPPFPIPQVFHPLTLPLISPSDVGGRDIAQPSLFEAHWDLFERDLSWSTDINQLCLVNINTASVSA